MLYSAVISVVWTVFILSLFSTWPTPSRFSFSPQDTCIAFQRFRMFRVDFQKLAPSRFTFSAWQRQNAYLCVCVLKKSEWNSELKGNRTQTKRKNFPLSRTGCWLVCGCVVSSSHPGSGWHRRLCYYILLATSSRYNSSQLTTDFTFPSLNTLKQFFLFILRFIICEQFFSTTRHGTLNWPAFSRSSFSYNLLLLPLQEWSSDWMLCSCVCVCVIFWFSYSVVLAGGLLLRTVKRINLCLFFFSFRHLRTE